MNEFIASIYSQPSFYLITTIHPRNKHKQGYENQDSARKWSRNKGLSHWDRAQLFSVYLQGKNVINLKNILRYESPLTFNGIIVLHLGFLQLTQHCCTQSSSLKKLLHTVAQNDQVKKVCWKFLQNNAKLKTQNYHMYKIIYLA